MKQFFEVLTLIVLYIFISDDDAFSQAKKLTQYVNPFIGTGGHGHTFPGPTMPFGACQVGPDTRLSGWDGCSGYHFSDGVIYGFSHTHLSGTGCSDYGDILLMPTTKEVTMKDYDYASSFSHLNEHAGAGTYDVRLDKWNINVELTCTKHVGIHQYNFPSNEEQYIVLDLKHRDEVLESKLTIINDSTIQGYRYSKAWASNQKIFFYIRFSRPFNEVRYGNDDAQKTETSPILFEKQLHTILSFGKNKNPLMVKVGISGVDEEGAKRNLLQEANYWNFETYKKLANAEWEKELNKITVSTDGINTNQLSTFYTALYHAMIHPSLYSDVDGRYRGRDDKIHNTDGKFDYYTVFSLWDTYRALHPLLSLIDKKRTGDFINTFIKQYEQGNRLPIWELSSNETNCMIGYHVVSVIWDAYSKGIKNFDVAKAYEAMIRIATHFTDYDKVDGKLKLKIFARKRCADADALESYVQYGYVRSDDSHESVSKTIEYAYDDWCIAQMANALNKKDDYVYYMKRSNAWMNEYDPTTGFMRARKNGTLYQPFSPYTVDNNYTEANSWQYSFYVPHNMYELIRLHGGKEKFEQHLDELFSAKEKTEGRQQDDISGLIGQYAHGNEPSHQLAYLYDNVGNTFKMQKIINKIRDSFYLNQPDGLIGNEDCGQMSAWYVMSALGLYEPCPGNKKFTICVPIFKNAVIHCSDQKTISISAKGFSTNQPLENGFDVSSNINQFGYANPLKNYVVNISPSQTKKSKPVSSLSKSTSSFIANPFIANTSRIFHDSVLVNMYQVQEFVNDKNDGKVQIHYFINKENKNRIYDHPFYVKDNTNISFYASNGSNLTSATQQASFTKLRNDEHVIIKSVYNPSYSANGVDAMIDGIFGKLNWRAGEWQGYQGQDVEIIIAFDSKRPISSLAANFLEDQNSWIFYPKEVSFFTSDDSLQWNHVQTIPTNKSDHNEVTTISKFKTSTPQISACKFVKMIAKNFGPMPQWHEGRGNETFIFIDEIEIK